GSPRLRHKGRRCRAASRGVLDAARTCKLSALARASVTGSPATIPASSAVSFMAAMRRPPVAGIARTNGRSGSIGLPARLIACVLRKRLIGQRGNQTETMRDMIVLHYPFTRPSVTAAFKLQLPTRTCVNAETVARGSRRADPPARRCGARFQRLRRPQQQQRQTGIGGGEMQFLAGLQ